MNLPGVWENYNDYNAAFVPYYVADEVVTMDALWCQEESVIQENLA